MLAIRHEFHQAQPRKTQPRRQLPFLDRRRRSIANQVASAAQTAIRVRAGLTAYGLQNGVESFGCKLTNALEEILGAVIDRGGAKRGHEFDFALGSRAEHLEARDFAKLERGSANTAGGAVHEESLPLAKLRDAVQHLVSGNVIENQADGLAGIEIVRHSNEMRGRNNRVPAVATDHGECRNSLASGEAADAVAERVDLAHDVITRSKGKRGRAGIKPVPHHDVGEGNASGDDFDAHLASRGRWQLLFDPFEDFRPAKAGDYHSSVFESDHGSLTQGSFSVHFLRAQAGNSCYKVFSPPTRIARRPSKRASFA